MSAYCALNLFQGRHVRREVGGEQRISTVIGTEFQKLPQCHCRGDLLDGQI